MKQPAILIKLPPDMSKRLVKLSKSQNTFPTRLATAMVVGAIPRMEAGELSVKTSPKKQ